MRLITPPLCPSSRALRTGLLGLAGLALAACGSSSKTSGGPDAGPIQTPSVTTAATGLASPFDATPSPDGSSIYFTALGEETGAVFRVAADGGTPALLAEGFSSPLSLVSSTDGMTLAVADAAWQPEDAAAGDLPGAIFRVPTAGGEPTMLPGTLGYAPRSLDLVGSDAGDLLYFSGVDPADGKAGVFRMPAAGGAITMVRKVGLIDPSGVAVMASGDVLVADTREGIAGAAVMRIRGDSVSPLIEGIRVGYPAGIALTMDETSLLVSGLAPDQASARVYLVDTATGEHSVVSDGIAQNTESAGVHRAHNADTWAWANADGLGEGGFGGSVYKISYLSRF